MGSNEGRYLAGMYCEYDASRKAASPKFAAPEARVSLGRASRQLRIQSAALARARAATA